MKSIKFVVLYLFIYFGEIWSISCGEHGIGLVANSYICVMYIQRRQEGKMSR